MTFDEPTPAPSSRVTASVRIVPAKSRRPEPRPEVRADGDWLHVTLAAPDIPEKRFRCVVRPRYVFAWADGLGHEHHRFVQLPHRVDPEGHVVRFVNGIVDARIRRAHAAPPTGPDGNAPQ